MKKTLLIFTLSLLFADCIVNHSNNSSDSEGFILSVDTITVHIRDLVRPATRAELSRAVKLNNKYYCLFSDYGLYYFMGKNMYFFILSPDGNIEQNIPLPESINNSYNFDLFVNNDTIFLKGERRNETYYLDTEHLNWKLTNHNSDIIYEDDSYCILHPLMHKLGCTTWFRDESGIEYELNSHGTIINKIDSTYYITSEERVLQIDNPAMLMLCPPERYYKVIKSKGYNWGSESMQGVKVLYGDSICNHLDCEAPRPEVIIFTSFVNNNELYHICRSDSSLMIARIDSSRLIPVHYFNEPGMKFELYNSDLMRIQKDKSQLLRFKTSNSNLSGIIEIREDKLDIRYLKHEVDTIEYLRKETFPIIFNFIRMHIDSLHITTADSLERALGGVCLRLHRKKPTYHSYFPHKDNFEFEGEEDYLKTEDEVITSTVSYDYTKNDSLVKSVFLEWLETKMFSDKYRTGYDRSKNTTKTTRFEKKLEDIVQTVNNILQVEPKKTKREQGKLMLEWRAADGLKVELYCEDLNKNRQIRLIIYK